MGRGKDGVYRCERGAHGIGKVLGRDKWVHISALKSLPIKDQTLVKQAREILDYENDVDIDVSRDVIVKINHKDKGGYVTFTYSPDWEWSSEPECGEAFGVKGLYTKKHEFWKIKPPKNPNIYHHKWMFVDDRHRGFNVAGAKRWSETWENHKVVRALMADKSEYFRLKIGKKKYWQENVLLPISGW